MNRVSMRLLVLVAALALAAAALPRFAARAPKPQSSTATAPPQSKFVGVAGCAAMACHGGTRPNERGEYTTWIERDRHARAYEVLSNALSQRITRNLGLKSPAQEEQTCLACHNTATREQGGPRFAIEDGVSCESCHGAAERWLVPHKQASWKQIAAHEKSEKYGMTNTKDAAVRAQVCVECHVGSAGREVNHDLIAAGHPALVFELDAYSANMPPHWRETPDKTATFGARAWAVGQAVSLRQSLELLRDRAKNNRWPEFAEFDCYACHHELRGDSWRQQLGAGDRRPGSPVWSSPQWLITQRLTASAGKPASGADEFAALQALLARSNSRATDVAAASEMALSATSQIVQQIAHESWDTTRLRRLLGELAAEPPAGSLDYGSAANLTMALGAVFEAIVRGESTAAGGSQNEWTKRVRPAIDRLYANVDRPAEFSAPKFLQDLKSLHDVVQK